MIGCECAVCRSDDPRDRRSRPSVLLDLPPLSVLIDTSTDLREQALRCRIPRVDAILFTHSHADHVMGLDDVRRFNELQKEAIPCFASDDTRARAAANIQLHVRRQHRERRRRAARRAARAGGSVLPGSVRSDRRADLARQDAGFTATASAGWPISRIAARIPEESWSLLEGLDCLVLDALRDRPHPTHFSLDQALAAVERLAPRRAPCSLILRTICRMPRPAPACRRAWNWHMMG